MNKPRIFICHSTKNISFVRWLVDRLHRDGIDTWFDEMEIKIGESIHQRISDGLKQSDFFAVVLSRYSVKSKWVQEELNSASAMEKYSQAGVFVLPLLLEECDVPPLLLDKRYANFHEDKESAYRELVDHVYHHFKEKHPETDVKHIEMPNVDQLFLDGIAENPDLLRLLSPRQFEEVIASALKDLGYKTSLTPITKDGGYDIVVQAETPEGMAPLTFVVECKRYSPKNPVSVEIVRGLYGALQDAPADRAAIVTTSRFTKDAKAAASHLRVDLLDYRDILKWLERLRTIGRNIDDIQSDAGGKNS